MQEQHLEKPGKSMDYKLNITEHADELLDELMYYLIYRLKNKQAAKHLLDSIDDIFITDLKIIRFSFLKAEILIWRRKDIGRLLCHK